MQRSDRDKDNIITKMTSYLTGMGTLSSMASLSEFFFFLTAISPILPSALITLSAVLKSFQECVEDVSCLQLSSLSG